MLSTFNYNIFSYMIEVECLLFHLLKEELTWFYLLFLIIIWANDAFNHLDDDYLNTLIHHLSLDQFIICFDFLLDELELSTFYDDNCKVDSDDFNASKIIEKYEGLMLQRRWKILMILIIQSLSCHHLFSLESISARWLSHILWRA